MKKKKSLTLATPQSPPLPPVRFFLLLELDSLSENSLSRFFVKENFTYPSPYPLPPTHQNNNSLMHHAWILVQSDTVNDLILNGGYCDLYIMVQRFCLVSLTISIRKTSYGHLSKQQVRQVVRGQPFKSNLFWLGVWGGGGEEGVGMFHNIFYCINHNNALLQ